MGSHHDYSLLVTTHHFVCMTSKPTLFTTLKKMQTTIGGSSNPPMHTGHMTTPTPHHFSGASQGGWTTYETGDIESHTGTQGGCIR